MEAEEYAVEYEVTNGMYDAGIHDQEGKVSLQQVEIEVLQAEQSKKEPVLKELFETNHSKDDELVRLVADSTSQRASMLAQLADVQQGIAKYNRMGLAIEQVGGEQCCYPWH